MAEKPDQAMRYIHAMVADLCFHSTLTAPATPLEPEALAGPNQVLNLKNLCSRSYFLSGFLLILVDYLNLSTCIITGSFLHYEEGLLKV